MGRGIAYPYQHFLIINEESFQLTDDKDEVIEWDDLAFNQFKEDAAKCFKAEMYLTPQYDKRDSHFFAEHKNFQIGINSSGGSPCIFLEPKEYDKGDDCYEYNINRFAIPGFNRLLKYYPDVLCKATSAWTTQQIKTYPSTKYNHFVCNYNQKNNCELKWSYACNNDRIFCKNFGKCRHCKNEIIGTDAKKTNGENFCKDCKYNKTYETN